MLPDITECDFFKKSTIINNGKNDKIFAFIWRVKGENAYNFMFTCPKCLSKNDYKDELRLEKAIKEKKEYIIIHCAKCGTEQKIERLKAKKR